MSASSRPPAGLGARGRSLWRDVTGKYRLDPAETVLLIELARTMDEIDRLTSALDGEPLVVSGLGGTPKAHPLLAEIRDHRKLSERLAAALALPLPGEQAGRRRSPQAKSAANTRWNRARNGPILRDTARESTSEGA
jgi:hypothetical protein